MTTYGPTETGWVQKTLPIIKFEVDERLKGGPLGQDAGTEPDGSIPGNSVAGQIAMLITDAQAGLWDLGEMVDASLDPSQSGGLALAALCELTGTIQDKAVSSQVTVTCTGTPGTPLPIGRILKVALLPWRQSTAYTVGLKRASNGNSYECVVAGTSSASGAGPTGTGAAIVDGGVTWAFIGSGDGSASGASFSNAAAATLALVAC